MFRLQNLLLLSTLILVCSAGIFLRDRKECGENEGYSENVSPCRPYCNQDPQELQRKVCNSRSYKGCYCLPGYTRAFSDSFNCIPKEYCKFTPICGPNQIYKLCVNSYIETCNNMTPSAYLGPCTNGCECKDGFVRLWNSRQSDCVPKSECKMIWKHI